MVFTVGTSSHGAGYGVQISASHKRAVGMAQFGSTIGAGSTSFKYDGEVRGVVSLVAMRNPEYLDPDAFRRNWRKLSACAFAVPAAHGRREQVDFPGTFGDPG